MQKQLFQSLTALLAIAFISGPAIAEDTSKLSDRERIQRLERMMESQGLVDLLMRLESLQQEVQQLRGDSEVQGHTLNDIKKRQRDLYIDIDRRLLQLERSNAGGSTYAPPPVAVSPRPKPEPVSPVPGPVPKIVQQPATSSAVVDDASEQQAYQQAFNLLRELRYAKAVVAFRSFIKKYPNGRYAHIAQYWLGEAGYAQGNFKTAIEDYTKLLDKYKNSPKRAQAMLKIGYSHHKLKNIKEAKATFNKVLKTFPGTTEAGQAQKMLKEIRLKRN
jgi:tol-pal system protein YbgF